MTETEKRVPDLRFKGFIEDWEQRKLGDIAEIKTGPFGSTLHAEDYVQSGIPIITTEHFKSGHLPESKDGTPQVSDEDYSRLKSYILKKGDIVFSRVGSVDINALVTTLQDGWLFSGRVLRVRSQNQIDSDYLHYLLDTLPVKNDIVSRAVGQTMPSINTEILKSTKLVLSKNIEEQELIAGTLRKLDDTLALHQRKLTLLEQLKQSYLQLMCPQNKGNIPALRFAGFSEPWEQRKIRELFTVTRGQVLAATKTKDKETNNFIYPVYSSQTKNNGLMGFYDQYLFENAITWTTDGANAGTVNFRKGKFYSTNVNGVLLSDKGFANKAISEIINKIAWKHVSKVGNPKLMNNVMSEITVTIPFVEEQNKLSLLFEQLDDTIDLHKCMLDKLLELRLVFLRKMFL